MVHSGKERWWLRGGVGVVAVAVAVLMSLVAATPHQAVARQETATALPAVPSPDECTVDPRRLPLDLETPEASTEAAASPSAADETSTAAPAPGPVDDDTVDAITDTVRQAIACQNAGEVLREFALYTDAFLVRYFDSPDALSEQDVATVAAADPAPVAAEEQLALVELRDARRLDDGRVRAVVVTEGTEGPFTDRLTFAEIDDRWLIDEFVAVAPPPTATAEAATEEAGEVGVYDEATAEP